MQKALSHDDGVLPNTKPTIIFRVHEGGKLQIETASQLYELRYMREGRREARSLNKGTPSNQVENMHDQPWNLDENKSLRITK